MTTDETTVESAPTTTAEKSGGLKLPMWAWLSLWIWVCVGGSIAAHYAIHGVVNGWQIALAFFLAINLLICVWEISLYFRIGDIERWFHRPGEGEARPKGNLYTTPVTLGELISTRKWALVWYGYAHYDASYADRKSFGFAIDVGNGFSTLLPSLFFLVAMSVPLVSPVVLGVVGLLIFYQKFYGTCLYFFTYFFNRRFVGHKLPSLLTMVGGTNGTWLVFPAVGLYVCLRLILENRYDVIWN